jgi:hypothetical protein
MGHSQWWCLIMVEIGSFYRLKIKIQELWWLFNIFLCVCPLSILLSSFCLLSNTIFLFFFLGFMFAYVYLYLHLFISMLPLYVSASLYLFLFSSLCFYVCSMFAYDFIFFCLPLSKLCSCLLLFVYVCFYMLFKIYLLLNFKFLVMWTFEF